MENIQNDLSMQDWDGDSVLDDMGQLVPGTIVSLHNNLIKALRKAYPQWADWWHISIDSRGGIVQVRNLRLSGDMGFVLHITDIDPEMRRVRQMAGELFERFGVARSKAMSIKRAMADVEIDRIGRIKHEK